MSVTYCDFYDVQHEVRRLTIDSTSVPSITDVEGYINQISAEMNATFAAAGVTLPVTDTEALLVAQQIAVYGVAAKVLRAAEMEPDREKEYQALYDARLKLVMSTPDMISPAAEVTAPAPSGFDPGDVGRKFHREDKDW